MKVEIDSTSELVQLVKLAHESPRPALLNRIARIARVHGVSRQRLAMLCKNAVESTWSPARRVDCPFVSEIKQANGTVRYEQVVPSIRAQQYC
jgi:hypothetical protein